MILKIKKKRLNIEVKKLSSLGRIYGLMFRTKNTRNLLFEFYKDTRMGIHSFFVTFPFIAIWVNENNEIIESKIVNPFTFCERPKKPFRKLIEVPINDKNKKIVKTITKDLNFRR